MPFSLADFRRIGKKWYVTTTGRHETPKSVRFWTFVPKSVQVLDERQKRVTGRHEWKGRTQSRISDDLLLSPSNGFRPLFALGCLMYNKRLCKKFTRRGCVSVCTAHKSLASLPLPRADGIVFQRCCHSWQGLENLVSPGTGIGIRFWVTFKSPDNNNSDRRHSVYHRLNGQRWQEILTVVPRCRG